MERFKACFVRFRGGNRFIIGFGLFLVGWLLASAWGFEWFTIERLNLILSVEASLATCLLLDQTSKQAERDREILTSSAQELEEVHEELHEIDAKLGPARRR